jgi:uncharacterized protein with PIN domain
MSFYEVDRYVAVPVEEPPAEPTNGHRAELAVAVPEAPSTAVAAPRRSKPAWIGSLAVGVVALIASGTLGFLTYSTTQERNATQRDLVATRATLVSAQADAQTRKVTADYVAMYVRDQGRVHLAYENLANCTSYGSCRTAGQQLLSDLQSFQADRTAAQVPANLRSTDSALGDALSAAIAATQQFIDGMDTFSVAKIKDGGRKLDAAMLAIAKVELSIGNELKF